MFFVLASPGGNTTSYVGILLLPCGAPKDEEEGLCGALLPHPLDSTSSTRGYPLRRGISAAAVDRDIGSLYPVQTVSTHFDVTFGGIVFGLKLFAFQKITPGICLSFFIGGGIDCSCLRLREVLLWSIVGITADRAIAPISLGASPFHQCCRVQKCRKNCVRTVKTSRKQILHTV